MPRKTAPQRSPLFPADALTAYGLLEGASPFSNGNLLHDLTYGQYRHGFMPMLPTVPAGPEAKRLREAVGMSRQTLARYLRLELSVLDAYEDGKLNLVSELLDLEYGYEDGPRRLYGIMAAVLAEQESKTNGAPETAPDSNEHGAKNGTASPVQS